MAAKLTNPVVVGPKTRLLEFSIIQAEQSHAQGGIKDLGLHPVDVLILQPFYRVPAARPAPLVAFLPNLG